MKMIKSMLKIQSGSFLSCHNFQKTQRKAFSVAEVLITLGVIGVIASIVLPMVKLKYQEITTVAKVRKVYALLNKGYEASIQRFGPVKYWKLEGTTELVSVDIIKYLVPTGLKVNYVENKLPHIRGRWLHNKNTNIIDSSRWQIYKMDNGATFFQVAMAASDCSYSHNNYNKANIFLQKVCGDFTVDINGEAGPNVYGIDHFQFYITERGIIPVGIKDDGYRPVRDYCNPKGDKKFNGYSCAAWMLEKGTMPWLYGKQVNWD